ncbi:MULTISPECIES: TetR/AcrR family transcriptional regulator [unclassified Brevibacterium]|uniref:TetR/AcrR family transcriptional regulator n=1 Tax=unclassified Brevibacterium TaxID=2614124 RepID=UPI000C5AF20F|nr:MULTISPECIES: TetR/AcrR family transcriptional regulator [unclassified Brevibacterium]SMX67547.1 transcriptional regulator, TetR family [Brevibacterium sp. 239c]
MDQSNRTALSREIILDATIECLLAEGYSATTTMKVQSRAGVTRGRLLHHFPSKRELLTAAVARLGEQRLDRHLEDRTDDLSRSLMRKRPPAAEVGPRSDWAVLTLWAGLMHSSFFTALELWGASRTDDLLAEKVRNHEKTVLERVRDNARELFGPKICASERYEHMFNILFSSMRGMAVTYTFSHLDPATEPMIGEWQRTARTLLAHTTTG